jgi:predicted Zn-dependent peptidase
METKQFKNIGETEYVEHLPNGLTVHVVTKPGYTKSYAFFATNYGGADRRFRLGGNWIDTPAGVAHFLEHKMFDTPDGGNALNTLSANGASPNAYTSSGITAYHFESTDGFYENLRCLLSFVSVPYFTAESVQKEQGIIGQEIRMIEDDPGFCVYQNLMKSLYASNPVRESVAGTVESIAEITEQTLYDCHRVFYNPSNMTLCVVGDVDPMRVVALAREVLPKEPGEVPARDYGPAEDAAPVTPRCEVAMSVSAPQFLIGAKVPPETGVTRLRQALTGQLAMHALLGRSSPFYTRLYADGLLTSDFDYELDYTAGTATLILGGESRDPEAVFTALADQVAAVARDGLGNEAFQRAKRLDFGARLRALGSFSSLCAELADGQFAGYDYLDAFHIVEEIRSDEVAHFITEHLAAQRLSMSVVRPTAERG